MSLTAIFTGIFAVFKSIPIVRDAFHAALSLYYQDMVDTARRNRTAGSKEYENAKTPEEYQAALGIIVRNSAK